VRRRANGKKHTLKINLKATRSENLGMEVFTETEEEEEEEEEQGYRGRGERRRGGNKSSPLN